MSSCSFGSLCFYPIVAFKRQQTHTIASRIFLVSVSLLTKLENFEEHQPTHWNGRLVVFINRAFEASL